MEILKKMRRIYAVTILSLVCCPMVGMAAEENPVITYDRDTQEITICGMFENAHIGQNLSLQILKPGQTTENIDQKNQEELRSIIHQLLSEKVTEEGKASFSFQMVGDSGEYTARLGGLGEVPAEKNFFYYSSTDLNKQLSRYNTPTGESSSDILEDELFRKTLGLDEDSYQLVKKTSSLAELMNQEIPYGSVKKIQESFYFYSITEAINEQIDAAGIGQIIDLYFDTVCLQENVKKMYNAFDASSKKNVQTAMLGKNYKNIEAVREDFRERVLLQEIRQMSNWIELQSFYEENTDILKLDKNAYATYLRKANKQSIDSQLVGKSFLSLSAFREAFSNAVNGSNSSGGTSGGSGSRPGSSVKQQGSSTTIIAAPSTQPQQNNNSQNVGFEDVSKDFWAYDAIMSLYEKKIVSGMDQNRFVPNQAVTREQFVKMLTGAFELQKQNDGTVFSDVEQDAWYAKGISTAVEAGVVFGIRDGYFGVGENISRQDMAVILSRACENIGINLSEKQNSNSFSDGNEISEYARKSVELLFDNAIISGFENNTYRPFDEVSRAQAATVIYRMLQIKQG